MLPERKSIPVKEYEDMLRKIKDVLNARIVADDLGNIAEVHVLAGPGRSVKHIARDVESAIIAAFGSQIDRRRISVAQLGGAEGGRQNKRIQLERVEIVSAVDAAEVNVCLKLDQDSATGTCRGMPTVKSWLYLAANATLSAMTQFLPREVSFHIEDVSVNDSRGRRIALVSLMVFASGRQQLLTGSCPVSEDEREAVVKATLDAINRKFEQLVAGT